jgi:hypothetical protein
MSRSSEEPRPRSGRLRTSDRGGQDPSVFVPARPGEERRPTRWKWYVLSFLALVAIGAVGLMVAWPSLHPRKLDVVERVAEGYLNALINEDQPATHRFGIVEEPPAIRSLQSFRRDRSQDRVLKGSFAPLGKLNSQIDADFNFDASIGRFTPKNAMGPAAETLDALHLAKEEAEKSGLYKKMESGNPEDLFDAAEQYGKVFTKLAEGVLAPKKILPTYLMLVESAKPPLPGEVRALAMEAAGSLATWDALLKRQFQTLKADGPFIFERARVNAMCLDRLASLGDPPSRIRLELVRFRLEGIDTGWRVVSARRVLPGEVEPQKPQSSVPSEPAVAKSKALSPGDSSVSPGEVAEPR